MRSNLEYMSAVPMQFKGERETQMESNRRAHEKIEPKYTLSWIISHVVGTNAVNLSNIRQWVARQPNPWTYLYGNPEGIDTPATVGLLAEMQEIITIVGADPDQWEEFQLSITDYLLSQDETQTEELIHADRWAELEPEDNSWSDPDTDPYMQSQFMSDVACDVDNLPKDVRFTDGSFDFPKYTVGSKNWGFYNEAMTQDYAFSLMRIRWFANMMLVGAVQIKSSGLATCGVSGCRWSHQLTANSVEGSTVFDRRYAEYQVLLILAHLGEHTRKNPANYWTPIDEVKRGRDTATSKLDSASKFCAVTETYRVTVPDLQPAF